eukprot:5557579-Karenia_brevis.AAC.1
MDFGEDGWEVPHEYMQSYIEQDRGNPFMFNLEDDRVVGWKPKDERLDIKHICDTIHDCVEQDSLEDMINSTKWWPVGSRPPKGVVHAFSAVLRSGADLLDDLRPEEKPGKVVQVT